MANNEKIPYFCRVVLQNFPFIEEDFDALTTYQLISKVVEYLNKVIKSQNTLVDNVNNLSLAFQQLHDYVEHYFDNLDVQEEINNKLDQMAEDGTLQEIITAYIQANVAWTFDTVADMKLAENLIDGSYAKTLGFYNLNDGGGATYYITDSGTADEMSVIAVGDLFANLVVNSEMDIRQYGAKLDGTDDSSVLSAALASNVKELAISGDIEIDSQITISSDNKYLKFYGSVDTTLTSCVFIIDSAENVTIDGATFDFNSLNACNCIYVKESVAKIQNCNFQNIKNTTASDEKDIIRVYEGCRCDIENCHFENIKITGNGTIGDNGGTGRCILLKSDDTTKPAIVNINNVSFKDCWNIDSEGNFLIEDFDDIQVTLSFTGQANISNIFSSDAGKRVLKLQGDNVNINNVEVDNSDTYESIGVISVMGNKNINISNVRIKDGNCHSIVIFRRCQNVNVNNVNGSFKNKTEPFTTNAGHLIFTGGDNINITNCNFTGGAYSFRVWEDVSNVHIANCYFESPHSIGQMTCRTESSASATADIKNITFDNCVFKTNETLNARALDIVPANDGTIKNIRFDKCKFIYTSHTYAYGLARFNGDNCVLNECEFDTTAGNGTILTNSAGSCVIIRGNLTNDEASTIALSGTAKLELDHSTTNNNISLTGTTCSLISEYTTHGTISYASSATSAQVIELTYS